MPNQFTVHRDPICTVQDCSSPHLARGFCQRHLIRVNKHGDPNALPRFDIKGRFMRQVRVTESCWLWTGSGTTAGYGQTTINYKQVMAHRLAYELFVGPIPDGMQIDHLCFVKGCVNPAHLEAVTPSENSRRAVAHYPPKARLTVCKNGHDLTTAEATRIVDGERRCAVCYRERRRAYTVARTANRAAPTHHANGCGQRTARALVDDWTAVTCKNCLGARVVLLRDGREVTE